MAVTVLIPTTLRIFTSQLSEIELEGTTVGEVISSLSDEYPETKKALFDESGKLRSFINIFVNSDNIKNLQGYETAVKDGDEIILIPLLQGVRRQTVFWATEKVRSLPMMRYSGIPVICC